MWNEIINQAVASNRQAAIDFIERKSIPVPECGCWLWLAGTNRGYAHAKLPSFENNVGMHRVSYAAHKGKLVKGMHVHHKCETPLCVNPAHLEQVTPQQNTLACKRAPATINSSKTHCVVGHPLSGDNLYFWNGRRMCRKCRYEQTMRYYSTRTTVVSRGRKPKCP